MRIANRFVARMSVGGLILTAAAALMAVPSKGIDWPWPEMRFRPVAATGNVICLPGEDACGETQIILSNGGVTVTLFVEFSGWDRDQDGYPGLGALQGTVDATTYQGGPAANPGTLEGFDLVPVGFPDMGFEGAFQSLEVCGDIFDSTDFDPLMPCRSFADCPTGTFCIERPDYIFYKLDNTPMVSTYTPNYWWSAVTFCAIDLEGGDTKFYFGTLLLEVPAGARGTYNVNFVDDGAYTAWNCCPACPIFGLTTTPGQITIMPDATDCDDNGVPDIFEGDLDDDGTIDACDGCPDDANKIEPGVCGCGVDDDLDSDDDGVPDCVDECPGVDDLLFAPDCAHEIPTVSTWGVIIMALLLFVGGKVLFGGRLVRR